MFSSAVLSVVLYYVAHVSAFTTYRISAYVDTHVSKRNLVQFGEMIECGTSRSVLDLVDYGCWCGKGGQGKVVDGLDK